MFNPIFKRDVQGRKYPKGWAFAEPELLTFRQPKLVIHNKNNDHENRNTSHNFHDEVELCQGIKVNCDKAVLFWYAIFAIWYAKDSVLIYRDADKSFGPFRLM